MVMFIVLVVALCAAYFAVYQSDKDPGRRNYLQERSALKWDRKMAKLKAKRASILQTDTPPPSAVLSQFEIRNTRPRSALSYIPQFGDGSRDDHPGGFENAGT